MSTFEVMGVVNVTPDSFSDGGRFLEHEAAIAHGNRLRDEGADWLDVGGESTRPGAAPVQADEELRRVIGVVEALAAAGARVSIDTSKAQVARAALSAGATLVNDVSALRADPAMAALVAEQGTTCCLMHMLGEPRTMQEDPRYDDVVSEVKAFLEERIAFAVAEGVREQRIWVDPGIGFGKTIDHNLTLLSRLDEIVALGRPVVIGTSRKSFLGKISGRELDQRLPGTIATNVLALARGARVFRVHEVAEVRDALQVAAAQLGRPMADDDEPDFDDDDLTEEEDDDEGPSIGVTVEITGLSLYTHHGVTAAEREVGQRLLVDVSFDIGEPDALITDRVEDTVDYAEVCQVIALVAQQRSYKTLERLCAVIADRLASQFGAESVTVKAAKPEPPLPLPVEQVSVEVWREEG